MSEKELVETAINAMKNSYSPYSRFAVGAALLCKSGKVYTGCNIENAAYSPTNCAERTAFFKAISEGEREFVSIAIAGQNQGKEIKLITPCGVCRQVMAEFCCGDFVILCAHSKGYEKNTLSQLLPKSFSLRE